MKFEKRFAVLNNKRTDQFHAEFVNLRERYKYSTMDADTLVAELYDIGYRIRNEHSLFPQPNMAVDSDYEVHDMAVKLVDSITINDRDTETISNIHELFESFYHTVRNMEGVTTWARINEQTDMYILESAGIGKAGKFVINNEVHTVWDVSTDESYNAYRVRRHEEAGI